MVLQYSYLLFCQRIRSKRQATSTVTKRGINFVQNVEHSLTQHSETLEQMLESVQKTEDLTKTLIENFANKYLKKPQMHENVEVYHEKTKQSNVTDNIALVPVSKKIPVYEKLLKHKQKIVEVSRDRKNLTLTTD